MSHRRKVLFLIDHLGQGGAQDLIFRFVEGGGAKNIEVEVACLHGQGRYLDKFKELGVRVHSLSPHAYAIPLQIWRLRKLIVSTKAETINLCLNGSTLVGHLALWLLKAKPKIVQWFVTDVPYLNALTRRIFVYGSYRSDRILIQHPALKEKLSAIGCEKSKILCMVYGQKKLSEKEARNFRKEFSCPSDASVVSRVCRFYPEKGMPELFDIMEELWKEMPEVKLLLAGTGVLNDYADKRIQSSSHPKNIFFVGECYQLKSFYEASDVVISPSTVEPLGMANIAAIQEGKPLVSFDIGYMHEAIEDGVNGALIPAYDIQKFAKALVSILSDSPKMKAMEGASRQIAKRNFDFGKYLLDFERAHLEF